VAATQRKSIQRWPNLLRCCPRHRLPPRARRRAVALLATHHQARTLRRSASNQQPITKHPSTRPAPLTAAASLPVTDRSTRVRTFRCYNGAPTTNPPAAISLRAASAGRSSERQQIGRDYVTIRWMHG
jgi:hypothetical protein